MLLLIVFFLSFSESVRCMVFFFLLFFNIVVDVERKDSASPISLQKGLILRFFNSFFGIISVFQPFSIPVSDLVGQSFTTGSDEFLLKSVDLGLITSGSTKGKFSFGLYESTSEPRPDENKRVGGLITIRDSIILPCDKRCIVSFNLPTSMTLKANTRYWIYSPESLDETRPMVW